MRKFKFGLQRVLDVREMKEKALLGELAAIRAEYDQERARLLRLIDSMECARNVLREKLTAGCADEIREVYAFMNGLEDRIERQQEVLRVIAERRDRKLAEVVEASRERKALEQLKERKRLEHKQEMERQEQVFMDDIAGIRFRHGTESADRSDRVDDMQPQG